MFALLRPHPLEYIKKRVSPSEQATHKSIKKEKSKNKTKVTIGIVDQGNDQDPPPERVDKVLV